MGREAKILREVAALRGDVAAVAELVVELLQRSLAADGAVQASQREGARRARIARAAKTSGMDLDVWLSHCEKNGLDAERALKGTSV